MKNMTLTCVLLLIALLFQCRKNDTLWEFKLGKAFAVEPAQQYEEAASNPGLRITFESVVSDSRCPALMNCILPGWVDIAFKFQLGDKTRSDTLSNPTVSSVQRPRSTTFEGYSIELQEVVPEPTSFDTPTPLESYRLKLLVTK